MFPSVTNLVENSLTVSDCVTCVLFIKKKQFFTDECISGMHAADLHAHAQMIFWPTQLCFRIKMHWHSGDKGQMVSVLCVR